MSEILFRGQRIDNGEWVEGYLYLTHNSEYEISFYNAETNIERMSYVVIPETVGQYTGLTDKNGKRIFEGDICLNTKTGEIVAVKWSGVFAGFVWHKPKKENSKLFDFGELYRVSDKFEVIGNIHDNPELLKGENNV